MNHPESLGPKHVLNRHWIDAHSHWTDSRLVGLLSQMKTEAQALGIQGWGQGGLEPSEWEQQLELKREHPEMILAFGLHPYKAAAFSFDEIEVALDQLARLLPKAQLLGETGLDLRSQYLVDLGFDKQMSAFEKQLELAEFAQKPVILHLVRAFDESLRVFEVWGAPKRAFVHAFNGDSKKAEAYLKWGLHISVGGAVTYSSAQKLHEAVRMIPMDRLLIETDAPDQPSLRFIQAEESAEKPLHPFKGLMDVAESVARIKGMTKEEVLDTTSQNFRGLIC